MAQKISLEGFTAELYDILNETFENVQGYFLDKGASFFETLDKISEKEASRPVSPDSACIAAIVEHVRFYLRVLEGSIQKKEVDKIDWQESWKLKGVTPEEWEDLKERLKETYKSVLTTMKSLDKWDVENDVGASLVILTHSAYHLGAIRQALRVIKYTQENNTSKLDS